MFRISIYMYLFIGQFTIKIVISDTPKNHNCNWPIWDREKMGNICLILSPQYIKSIVLSQKNLTFDHQRKSLYPNDCSHENGAPLGTMQTILFFSILLLIHFLIYLRVYGTSSFYT